MRSSELAKELGTSPSHVGRIRNALFPMGDKNNITKDQAAAITEYIKGVATAVVNGDLLETVEPRYVKATVSYVPKTGRRVECYLHDSRQRVIALMPSLGDMQQLCQRELLLEAIEYNGKSYYRHERLSSTSFTPH